MNLEKYKEICKKYTPEEDRIRNSVVAFFVGGSIGMVGQLLIDFYRNVFYLTFNDASLLMIMSLIITACLLTSLGFFDNWVKNCGAGLIIPITGFAHAMQSSAMEYKKEGLITGIGANIFKLTGSVILYGIVSAYIVGLIRYMVGLI
ncbi:MAG: stage V sporulation protein AC [Bacilli bacterium]